MNSSFILRIIIFLFINVTSLCLWAQYAPYPRNYFMFPIKPGMRNYLSGNMGELRTNHFHGGLDIKTDQKTGLAVHASANGYVSRIAVSSRGYGNALYITHPNGLTTVYAHLEWFNGQIASYIKEFLYKEQCNETDIQLPKDFLQVTKGEIIAKSGNTGSSGGPHLHWEIRDENERILNPLFFDFTEIADDLPPVINKMALRALDIESRIEGEFGRNEFIPVKEINNYVLRYPVHASGFLGLELVAYDRMNGTGNLYGISLLEVYLDGKKIFSHDIQRIGFDENPFINVHIDYATALTKRNMFQRCYVADGNFLNTYKTESLNGKMKITDTLLHDVTVKVVDAYQNATRLNFKIKGSARKMTITQPVKPRKTVPYLRHSEFENVLKIESFGNNENLSALFFKGKKMDLNPVYIKNGEKVYLWDLRQGLPDSIIAGKQVHKFEFEEVIPSQNTVNYSHKYMDILFPKKSVFDTLFLNLNYTDGIYTFHRPSFPLFSPVTVTLKPEVEVQNKSKSAVYAIDAKSRLKFSGGIWVGNNIKFGTKVFGNFKIEEDTISPKITYYKKIGNNYYFKMSDNKSGISQWYAYLNGNFLLMHYEAKYNMIFTHPYNEEALIKGSLIIGAIDNMGNSTQKEFTF